MNFEKTKEIPDIYEKALHYVFEKGMVPEGLWLEFGVHGGGTINRISRYTSGLVHGFDSFEGLPEAWTGRVEANGVHYPKSAFSLGGVMPKVNPNVRLYKGWFCNTLPPFLETHKEPIKFIHIDSDIYSSCKEILELTKKQISHDCVIVFDELVDYPGWENHEWKAWWEFVSETGLQFEWIGGNSSRKIVKDESVPRFDRDKPPTENVSPSWENAAVRVTFNPLFK